MLIESVLSGLYYYYYRYHIKTSLLGPYQCHCVVVVVVVVVYIACLLLTCYINVSCFLSGTRTLLARSDELKTDAMAALQHVIRLQSGK